MAPPMKTFQLLEINVISAQDLEPVSKKMKTYATAWMNPKRKLSSCVDADGHTNPTWNDKFVFRVEEDFLRRDTAAVMIEIYAGHWFKDVLIGTVRVLVGNLVPPPDIRTQHNGYIGMRFVALQIRRPSGRPQGILNLGVAVLDPSMRSMPLYTQPAMSAVGYRDLMDGPPPHHLPQNENNNNNNDNLQASALKPILRRSRSERSELQGLENFSPSSSMIIVKSKPKAKESSILSITECMVPLDPIVMKKAGKASSVINGAELHERPRYRGKKSRASSVVSDSVVSKETTAFQRKDLNEKDTKTEVKPLTLTLTPEKQGFEEVNVKAIIKAVEEKQAAKPNAVINFSPPKEKLTIGKPITKFNGYDYGGPKPQGKYGIGAPFKKGSSMLSADSEVGPSPSEVAAAVMMAERRYPLEDNQSSVLDGWSMDESVEGLRSKLERWRMELPPLYDRGGYSTSSYKSSSYRTRRNGGGGGGGNNNNETGAFSCFGNIFGYECQCVCGKPNKARKGGRGYNSPSASTPGRSFI